MRVARGLWVLFPVVAGWLTSCEDDDLLPPTDAGADAPALDGPASNPSACGFVEPEPNDDPSSATALSPGQRARGCLGPGDDLDSYALTAPAQPAAGGWFQAEIVDVGRGQVEIAVHSARDEARLLGMVRTFDEGAPLSFYWAAAPAERYRLAITRFGPGREPFSYSVSATFTGIEDPFEPNDTSEQARPLSPGVTVHPYFFAGFRGQDLGSDAYDDWFSVELAARPVTIALGDAPADVGPQLRLIDPSGQERASQINSEPGGAVSLTSAITTAGTYRVRVSIFSVRPAAAGESRMPGAVPASFTRPYSLRVSQ